MCCWLRNRPRNLSQSRRSPTLPCISAPTRRDRLPAPTCRSTAAGPRNKRGAARSVRMKKILASLLPGRATEQNPASSTKRINLALQGGGAHGAFTWGVLETLLSDERLAIEGISGTSAGAVNAVMLADGLISGGREEAQKRLADFWGG